MKIVHVIGSIDQSAGGPSRSVTQLCFYLASQDVKVEIWTRPSPKPIIEEHENLKIRFLNPIQLLRTFLKIRTDDFSLIHLQHIWDPYIHIAAFFARRYKIPYLISPRGMLEPWILNRNRWKKQIALRVYQKRDLMKANCIHVTGPIEAQNVATLGFNNKIVEIPNGIDLSKIPPIERTYGSKKVLFLSRIHPKKGIEILLKVWKEMETRGWVLEIAGNGDINYVTKLKEMASDKVRFLGPVYGVEKWKLLSSADILVLPTYSENFGIVVAESLAVGTPVITTKETPWEELEQFNCGKWIQLNDENIQLAMTYFMSLYPSEVKKMGENGISLISHRYQIGVVASEMLGLYKKIIHSQLAAKD